MKTYEGQETDRKFTPTLPIYARIDGRGFSRFTRGMDRPYDIRMSRCMLETTKYLVEHTHALLGYTQSDEISLVWLFEGPTTDPLFGGKIQKLNSILSGITTAAFINNLIKVGWSDKVEKHPHFDTRVFNLPSKTEAANAFLWRELDATKNAVSMAARSVYSHKELQGKSSKEMQEMLFAKGINFNDYPAFFKRGTFVKRVTSDRKLTEDEFLKIPERHRPDRDALLTRSEVKVLEVPRFSTVENREEFVFGK